MKKGKTLGKRRSRPLMEEEKREVRRITQRTVKELMQNINQYKGSAKEFTMLSDRLNSMAHQGIDVGYIKTLLFPELYNADIPQPMSTQSYCRFTDKKELTINSKSSGMLIWFPKTIIGPQLFLRTGAGIDTPIDIFLNTGEQGVAANPFKKGASVNYARYFSQASLVSGAISIQYIGQLQKEQGYMVGSQVYGVNCNTVTPEDAETGQFRVMSKPGDGLRMVYLPKDSSDFTYYTCMISDETRSGNNGARQANQLQTLNYPAQSSNWIEGQPASNWPGGEAKLSLKYAADADYFVIYWKGLAGEDEGTSDLRIDIVRKFNGFPLAEQREVLDLIKPKKLFDPKKTIDVVCELQDVVPQIGGHTLKQMDRISDQIQEFLPNIGHLYNEGLLKEGTSLDGFAQQLQSVAGVEGQMNGNIGRIYD